MRIAALTCSVEAPPTYIISADAPYQLKKKKALLLPPKGVFEQEGQPIFLVHVAALFFRLVALFRSVLGTHKRNHYVHCINF